MRTVAFFISLCFYLLSGGNHLHADTSHIRISHSSSSLENGTQDKFINGIHTSIIIDDADFDLDEEFSSSNTKEESSNKALVSNYFLLNNLYLTNAPKNTLNRSNTFFKIFHNFCGNSAPIYIKNRTLRI